MNCNVMSWWCCADYCADCAFATELIPWRCGRTRYRSLRALIISWRTGWMCFGAVPATAPRISIDIKQFRDRGWRALGCGKN